MLYVKKDKGSFIGYNESTHIAVQSGKRDKSAAASYIKKFWALLSLDKFKEVCLKDGILNSMLFVSVDGGPDDAPGRN